MWKNGLRKADFGLRGGYGSLHEPILCSALRARAYGPHLSWQGFLDRRWLFTSDLKVYSRPCAWSRESAALSFGMLDIRRKISPPGHGDRRFWACMRFSNPSVQISHLYLRPSGRHLPDHPDHPDHPEISKVNPPGHVAVRLTPNNESASIQKSDK